MNIKDILASRDVELFTSGTCTKLNAGIAKPIFDINSAVEGALEAPLDFPPFASAMVPGDRIAIAVDSSIPKLNEVIQAVVSYLLKHGGELDNISVVLSPCTTAVLDWCRQQFPAEFQEKLACYMHQPDQPGELGYLAATEEDAAPIYINRRLLDADLVLPITCYRASSSISYSGVSGISPLFADNETIKQFSSLTQLGSKLDQVKRREDADRTSWLLGIQCILQVCPAGHGNVAAFLVGTPGAVQKESEKEISTKLALAPQSPCDVVIAAIDGGANEQTWQNFARTLYLAKSLIKNKGTIVILSHLKVSPSSSLRRLTGLESAATIEKQLAKDHQPDTLAASLIAEYASSCRICLQSDLGAEEVEDLGIAPISNDQQVEKIIQQQGRVLWIPAAQHRGFAV
jgi:nickel-dependent lactate racemase